MCAQQRALSNPRSATFTQQTALSKLLEISIHRNPLRHIFRDNQETTVVFGR